MPLFKEIKRTFLSRNLTPRDPYSPLNSAFTQSLVSATIIMLK